MNRFKILFALFLAVSCGTLFAVPRPKRGTAIMRSPGMYVSETVFYSSSTCVDTTAQTSTGAFLIANGPAHVYGVNIGSGTVTSSFFRLINGANTFNNFIVQLSTVDARTARFVPYDMQFSSGVILWNQGNCVDVLYYEE